MLLAGDRILKTVARVAVFSQRLQDLGIILFVTTGF